MASSLRAGLGGLSGTAEAVIVLLGDQPFQGAEVIERLVQTYRETGRPIVVPLYGGRRGNPVRPDRPTIDTGVAFVQVELPGLGAQGIVVREQGVVLTSSDATYVAFQAYVSSEISTEATRWRGANSGGYSNPTYDQLYKQLLSTLTASQRDPIAADLVKLGLDDMTYLPLEWSDDISAAAKNVGGITTVPVVQRVNAWNIHVWELF